MSQQSSAEGLLVLGYQALEEGNTEFARSVFDGLKDIPDFTYAKHARHWLALAKARCSLYFEANGDLESLLADKFSCPEGTTFRADVLCSLIEIRLGMDQTDGIDELLREAAEIYDHQSILPSIGMVKQLQGQVALKVGHNPTQAMREIKHGAMLAQLVKSKVGPLSFTIDQKFIGREAQATRSIATVGATSS